jgi:energy-converting hydrogenase Eha subunit A
MSKRSFSFSFPTTTIVIAGLISALSIGLGKDGQETATTIAAVAGTAYQASINAYKKQRQEDDEDDDLNL